MDSKSRNPDAEFPSAERQFIEEDVRRESLLKRPCPLGEFVSLITPDYRYASVNPGHAAAQGSTVEDLLGRNLSEIWGEETFLRVIRGHIEACLAGEVVHYQSWFDFPKTGRRCWEVSYYPYREDGGPITHAMVVTRDVTLQQRAADLLNLEANVLELIARGISLKGIWETLREEVGKTVPGAELEIRLKSPIDGVPDLIPKEGIEPTEEAASPHITLTHPFLSGGETMLGTLSLHLSPADWMQPYHSEVLEFVAKLVGIAVDRHRAERDLARLGAAIEQAGECIILTDPRGIIQYVNPAFERCTGYSRDEARGSDISMLDAGDQEDSFRRLVLEELRRGNLWSGRFVNRRKDGSLYENEATVTPVYDSEGELISFVSVQRDVTDQVNLENQLRQSQKMEAVGQLAGGVAHDFNNILQAIFGSSDLALMETPADWTARQDVEDIIRSAERGTELVRQLLAFSRKEAFEPTRIDLNGLIRDMTKMLKRLLGEEYQIVFLEENGLPQMIGDRGQIEQVILNLVLNARDAMPGGGRITIQSAKTTPPQGVQYYPAEPMRRNYIRMSIADDGNGIPREIQDRIFEPFFTTKEVGKGTGLGLSIVFGILKQHGAGLHFESRLQRGTRFDLYFPIAGDVEAEEGERRAVRGSGSHLRGKENGEWILVAEDDDRIREVTSAMLRKAGYRVIESHDGRSAEAAFRSHVSEVALALLDVRMPNGSGRDVYEAIRVYRPTLPVIFATGYSGEAIDDCLVSDPQASILRKPFRESELLAKVGEAIRTSSPG